MVSTETGHKSKKKRAGNGTKSRRNKNQETYLNMHYDLPRSVFEGRNRLAVTPEDHVYDVVRTRDDTYENVDQQTSSLYQNVDSMYDRPRGTVFVQTHYENLTFEEEDHTYLNIRSNKKSDCDEKNTYDIPRSSMAIYDHPTSSNGTNSSTDNTYDFPKSLIPLSARLLLNARNRGAVTGSKKDNGHGECDTDSLDGDRESVSDYQQAVDDNSSDRRSGSSPDEGIGELDVKALDVIVEEAEEENYPNLVYAENAVLRDAGQHLLKSRKKTAEPAKKRRDVLVIEKAPNHNTNESSLSELDSSSVTSVSTEDDSSHIKVNVKDSPRGSQDEGTEEATKNQKDRSIDVYHETLRQRNNKAKGKAKDLSTFQMTSAKEGPDNLSTIRRMRKLLPSVKALRNQFEPRAAEINRRTNGELSTVVRKWKSSSSFKESGEVENNRSRSSSLGSLDEISSTSSNSSIKVCNNLFGDLTQLSPTNKALALCGISTFPINEEFQEASKSESDLCKPRHSTSQWDPTALLEELYKIESLTEKSAEEDGNTCTNIDGYLEKLPSGRRKATFWNAWKSRYFRLKDGSLYYYQTTLSEKPNTILQLSGGVVENMDNNMIGIDDGKGHYMVIRGSSKQETERWFQALLTHVNHNTKNNYIQPSPIPRDPSLLKPVIIIDLGSSSVRGGILSVQATLPWVFFPSIVAVDKNSGSVIAVGSQSLLPEVRMKSTLVYPIRPSNKMSKHMLDLPTVTALFRNAFQQLSVDPAEYAIQVSVPRHLNTETQLEILRILFDTFGVKAVNLTHQSVLCLLSYNASSGIVVDIGERIDIVPIMDGYILESSVSHVPYGGQQLVDHLRHFLVQQRYSLITDVESYLIRYILEKLAYVAGPDVSGYANELNKARKDPSAVRGTVDVQSFGNGHLPWESVSLELGRFQVTEGLFHPEAWGLDNSGIQTLITKAVQDCSVDIRKEMVRSIYLGGGITMLKGFPERLEAEISKLVPSHLIPKVHASPYRYHASYIGACALSNSPAFEQSKVNREDWSAGKEQVVLMWKI